MHQDRKKQNTEQVIKKFRTKHGDYYDYSKVDFVDSHAKVTIVCPTHGAFQQTPAIHLRGSGCTSCNNAKRGEGRRKSPEAMIEAFKGVHGLRYDYTPTVYTTSRIKVTVNCRIHGAFDILPTNHLRGQGCGLCSSASTQPVVQPDVLDRVHQPPTGKIEIGDFLEQLGAEVIRDTKVLIPTKEIALYLPEHQLAIEYCGVYWIDETRGKDPKANFEKMEALNQRGIDLITIFEDEWLDRPEVVRSILTNRLGKSDAGVGGRQLQIEEITSGESRTFLNKHHIQGAATGSYHIGAFHKGVLVGVMVMGPPTRQMSLYQWELKRFAADGRNHPGMMGRLFNHFLRTHHPETIVSFSDNRWFPGGSYQQLGFVKEAEIAPDHYYVKDGVRYHKSKFRKSGILRLHPEHYDETLTERVMMENIGYGRVWDCGKIRWVWARLIEDQGSS